MNLLYIAATIAFTALGVIFAGMFIMDLLDYINETFSDEIGEIPAEKAPEVFTDKFEELYINVADGDRENRDYWLKSVAKGGE